jgi:hypothetical protein
MKDRPKSQQYYTEQDTQDDDQHQSFPEFR